jgi:hypothetical protein
MTSGRRESHPWRPVLMLGSLCLLIWPRVAATAFNCVANASVPPLLRAESITDQAADVTIVCFEGTPTPDGQPIPAFDVRLVANTSVTSRVLANPWSEVLLLLDDPGSSFPGSPSTQAPCHGPDGICSNNGNGQGRANGTNPNYYVGQGTGTNVNVFQGYVEAGNTVVFPSVPIDAPGGVEMRILRITNLRLDAHALAAGGGFEATAQVSFEGASPPPLDNAIVTVGYATSSAEFSVRDAGNTGPLSSAVPISQCASIMNVKIGTLRFAETGGTTFKKLSAASSSLMPTEVDQQNVPGVIYNTETGFYSAEFVGSPARGSLDRAGLADSGTRLRAAFNNVPAGVSIYVDNIPSGSGDVARRTASESGTFAGTGDTPGGPVGTSAVSLADGSGVAVWELTDVNSVARTDLDVGVYVSYAGAPPALGSATVNAGFAPVSGDATGPVPRFADTSSGFALFAVAAGPECDALCGGACEDGDACTGYDACAPDGRCVSPAALSGFPRAACEIGRLEPSGLCSGVTFSRGLERLIDKNRARALTLLGQAESTSKPARQDRLLRKTGARLRRIDRKVQRMGRLVDSCRGTIAGIVAAGTASIDAL